VFLDPIIALGTAVVTSALVLLAAWIASRGSIRRWSAFGALFVGGWILQKLVGHAFEGRKPALATISSRSSSRRSFSARSGVWR